MAASAATAVPTAIRFNIAFSYAGGPEGPPLRSGDTFDAGGPEGPSLRSASTVLFDLAEQFALVEHVGAGRPITGNEHPHFFIMGAVVVQAARRMTHELAGFQTDFFAVLPGLGAFARVPRSPQHDAVPLVGVRVRAAHRVGRESVDRQV